MRPERRLFVSTIGAALALAALPALGQAPGGWMPAKPIHVIVPFTAGSATTGASMSALELFPSMASAMRSRPQ